MKFPGTVLPDAIGLSLIGKIGGTTAVGTGTPVPEGVPGKGAGFVGSSYSQPIPTSGRLFLGFNDDFFLDNSGAFDVMVTVVTVVDIDVKPGSDPNGVNPRSKGVIPVAVLTTDDFDAADVDPATVLFGATGTEAAPTRSAVEDADEDSDADLVLHFSTQDTGIACGDTSASLTGETFGGQDIEGSDAIVTVGCG